MQRLRNISQHILSSATTAGAATHDVTPPKLGALTAEELQEVLQVLVKFRQGADELKEKGTFPELSFWDMLLASKHKSLSPSREQIGSMIEAAEEDGSLAALDKFPGPWQDAHNLEDKIDCILTVVRAGVEGNDMHLFSEFMLKYGQDGLGSNIIVPRMQMIGTGMNTQTRVIARIILGNPADAERVSNIHVRKEGNFEQAIYDCVLSTTDNEHWRTQRRHLSEVFLPLSVLSKILPTSLARARHCADRLAKLAANDAVVDMSDFLLHEAQAQLQLSLLGAPDELMNETNEGIRAAFMNDIKNGKVGDLGKAMKKLMAHAASDKTLALPTDDAPVRGPLSRACATSGFNASANYGNMLLILFAGHDTTGHTMTWLLFELARNPDIAKKLAQDIDAFFKELNGRDPTYKDLASKHLDLLDRCVTEALRLWPAVANGSFRQLQFADSLTGKNGQQCEVPKGTYVQVPNLPRHRNPKLWGDDANIFNPYREFREEELARVGGPLSAKTIQSERFSPFSHSPRSCLGRNFAQMEMRLIMSHLLHRFEFRLAAPYDKLVGEKAAPSPGVNEFRGVNRGTFGPIDLDNLNPSEETAKHGYWYTYALRVHVNPRGQ